MPKRPFYICKLEDAVLNRNILRVTLKEKNFIKNVKLNNRGLAKNKWLELLRIGKNPSADFVKKNKKVIADKNHPIRWVGAGSMLVLEDINHKKFIVINKRHYLSTWPNHLDVNGGYSSSVEDMLHPDRLAMRELKEEVLIKKNGKKAKIKANVLKLSKTITIDVSFKNRKYTTRNLILIVDADTGVIDLRQIVKMKIDDIKNYTFEDGETRFTGKYKEVSQKRKIYVIPLEKLTKMFKNGKEKFTPSLTVMIKNYAKYI